MSEPRPETDRNAVHVMIDIETLGLRPDSVVVSIGACVFQHVDDQGLPSVSDRAHFVLGVESQTRIGRHVDPATMIWWSKQQIEARDVVQEAVQTNEDYGHSLLNLDIYLNERCSGDESRLRIWSDGAGFDPVILADLYRSSALREPYWPWWATRCYRTLRAHVPIDTMPIDRPEVPHHAMHDAIAQARNASRWLSWLTEKAGGAA